MQLNHGCKRINIREDCAVSLGLDGHTIKDKGRLFVEMARKDHNWAFNKILVFVEYQNIRIIE